METEYIAKPRIDRLHCSFGTGNAILYALFWLILSIITLGLAVLVFPYYLNRAVLNQTVVLDSSGRVIGRLDCQFNLGQSIVNLILWGLLILVTFGLAAFIYVYRVIRVVLNETRIIYH